MCVWRVLLMFNRYVHLRIRCSPHICVTMVVAMWRAGTDSSGIYVLYTQLLCMCMHASVVRVLVVCGAVYV